MKFDDPSSKEKDVSRIPPVHKEEDTPAKQNYSKSRHAKKKSDRAKHKQNEVEKEVKWGDISDNRRVCFAIIFEEWFRLFTWRRRPGFDLESFVKPYIERMLRRRFQVWLEENPEVLPSLSDITDTNLLDLWELFCGCSDERKPFFANQEATQLKGFCLTNAQLKDIRKLNRENSKLWEDLEKLFDRHPVKCQALKKKLQADFIDAEIMDIADEIVDRDKRTSAQTPSWHH